MEYGFANYELVSKFAPRMPEAIIPKKPLMRIKGKTVSLKPIPNKRIVNPFASKGLNHGIDRILSKSYKDEPRDNAGRWVSPEKQKFDDKLAENKRYFPDRSNEENLALTVEWAKLVTKGKEYRRKYPIDIDEEDDWRIVGDEPLTDDEQWTPKEIKEINRIYHANIKSGRFKDDPAFGIGFGGEKNDAAWDAQDVVYYNRIMGNKKWTIIVEDGITNPAGYGFANSHVSKRDYKAKQRRAMAKHGLALPDGSFPIRTKKDLSNAKKLAGLSKHPELARAHIARREQELGL